MCALTKHGANLERNDISWWDFYGVGFRTNEGKLGICSSIKYEGCFG